MRKSTVFVLAIVLACGGAAMAGTLPVTGFGHDAYASQISLDSFNMSVKQRMEMARFAFYGGPISAPPASYTARVAECSSGVTVWADGYGAWAKQKERHGDAGYSYKVGGPAMGVDWSNGPLTLGLAGTYNWGKIKYRGDTSHDRQTRTWALTAYGQINYERFYANAQLSYGRNRYKSDRYEAQVLERADDHKYHSNAWNAEMEIGTRLNYCNFVFTPHIGLRYFHDRRKAFTESFTTGSYRYGKRNYHTLEMPLGVDIGYQFEIFNTVLVPKLKFAWVPQWDRSNARARATGTGALAGSNYRYSEKLRGKHGFRLGAGVQTDITQRVTLHVDYNVDMHTKAYEHRLNAGLGVSF